MKNSYPLPLISDLVDNMGTKRVFTKMDLRWGYNNIRIKEGDGEGGQKKLWVWSELEV